MKIQLVQSEIELAISNYIRETITVNEGMVITMELRATRGAEGFQADIDISRAGTAVVATETPAARPAVTRAAPKPATVGQPTTQAAQRPAATPAVAQPPAVEPDEQQAPVDSQPQVEQPAETNDVGAEQAADPVAQPAPETEAPKPVARSLFSNLSRPKNA